MRRMQILAVLLVGISLLLVGSSSHPQADAANALAFAGEVLGPDGQPVAGARVWLTTEAWVEYKGPTLLTETETDGQGRFEFSAPPPVPDEPGSYSICAHTEGYAFAWAGRLRQADVALRLVLEPEFPLSGRVIDAQGNPVVGIRPRVTFLVRDPGFDPLEIYDLGSVLAPPAQLSEMMVSASDENGQFEIHNLPAGVDLSLEVDEEKYARQRIWRHWAELMAGQPIEIALQEPGTIRGRVYRAADGSPVAGVEVAAYSGAKALTDEQGRYEITNLRPAVYQVYLHELPLEFTAAAGTEITVEPGVTVEGVDLEVIPGFEIKGIATDQATGEPIPNLGVCCNTVQQPKVGMAWPVVRTGPDGRYSLRAPEGPAQVRPLHVPKGWRPAKTMGWDTEYFTVSPEGAPFEVNIEAVRARAISGTVVGPDGQAAPYARVLLNTDKDYGFISRATADGEGRFSYPNVRPDATCVLNAHLGESQTLETAVVAPGDEGSVTLRLTANARPALTGRIVGEDGQPVPYAIVRVDFVGRREAQDGRVLFYGDKWSFISNAIADKAGQFKLRAAWGTGIGATLRVRAAGYAEQEQQLEALASGEHRDLGEVVLPIADVVISGVVLDEKDQPVPNAQVDVRRSHGPFSRWVMGVTDLQGHFHIEGLPREEMMVTADQFEFDGMPVEVGPESQEVTLRVIRRSDQILYTHRLDPPLEGAAGGVRATLTALHRFQAFTPRGEVEHYLGLELDIERDEDRRLSLSVSVVDDHGRWLTQASATWRIEGPPRSAFALPEADVAALAQIIVSDRPVRAGEPMEIGTLRLREPGGPRQRNFVLWAVALAEEPLGKEHEHQAPRGPGPYLVARVYAVCQPDRRYDIASATSGPDGLELAAVATYEYSLPDDEVKLPEALQQWEAELRQEAKFVIGFLRPFSEAGVPDDAIVQGFWLESAGGHGQIPLPESVELTVVPRSVPTWSEVLFETMPLPPELTQAVEF